MTQSKTERGNKIPWKLTCLREKLGQKAKREQNFRFYTLYGHLLREDVLRMAWILVRKNGGCPGVDNRSFEDIESSNGGSTGFLKEIQTSLRDKTYKPDYVKRVDIPKANGKSRPLGIPIIKDRVVQMALLLIIEPIFESDFLDCSYGFRPNRSAHQAIREIRLAINNGMNQIYDADIQGYFDSIPHDKLMLAIQHRIADRHVLKLIRMWLKAPIWEEKKPISKTKAGTPQGGVISPLLANVFLHWFDKVFHFPDGPASTAGAKLVRYADDFVVLVNHLTPQIEGFIEEKIEGWMGLKLNREKTQKVDLSDGKEHLDFLGYTFKYISMNKRPKQRYCYLKVSEQALMRARGKLRKLTHPSNCYIPPEKVAKRLSVFLKGWGSYFCLGYPSRSFEKLNGYAGYRLARHLKRRSQRGYKIGRDESWYEHLNKLGLVKIRKNMFCANA